MSSENKNDILTLVIEAPVSGSTWSLPSLTPLCSAVIMQARSLDIPCQFRINHYPHATVDPKKNVTKQSLPTAICGSDCTDDVHTYLAKHYSDIDSDFTDAASYRSFIMSGLEPVYSYMMWMDPVSNYGYVMGRYFARSIPLLVGESARYAQRITETQHLKELRMDVHDNVIIQMNNILTSLSNKLDNKPFLFGNMPSSADFLLAAYVMHMYHIPPTDMDDDTVSFQFRSQVDSKFRNLLRHAQCIQHFFLASRTEQTQIDLPSLNISEEGSATLWKLYNEARLFTDYKRNGPREFPPLVNRQDAIKISLQHAEEAEKKKKSRMISEPQLKVVAGFVATIGILTYIQRRRSKSMN